MRVPKIDTGHRLREKAVMKMMHMMSGHPAPDVVKTILYRRDFWGDPYNEGLQKIMRGPSEWSVGERELFAAAVSQTVHCEF